MKALMVMGVGFMLLIGCASAQTSSETQGKSKPATCGIEGFTKSPSEHIVVELEQAFRVRAVEGLVTSQGGDWPEGTAVLIELRPARGAGSLRQVRTDSRGVFKIPDIAPGEYCFKATAEGWQSVVGVLVVSKTADPATKVNFEMLLGV